MQKYINQLTKCKLFEGCDEAVISKLLPCLKAQIKTYAKDEMILSQGSMISNIGIILYGSAVISSVNLLGKRSIQTTLHTNDLFAETFACAISHIINVDVVARESCTVLFLDAYQMMHPCAQGCSHHTLLMNQLMQIIASKNLYLQQKLMILSKRTTREKLLTYLEFEAQKHQSNEFAITLNRNELADYLECDRSGLSVVISKLKDESLIDYQKNKFVLKR